jgi:ADP-dependent NAD(P)H-hydrate dehydratase / NAD(P)H-hydrate epimerase
MPRPLSQHTQLGGVARIGYLKTMWTPGPEILAVDDMAEVDRLTIASGTPSLVLMENAGRQVANEIAKRWSVRKTTVLCGPGNNGGDGYVVARHLQARGYEVEVVTFAGNALKPDAAVMAGQWKGPTRKFDPKEPVHGDLFVDAIFGAGLSRGLSPELSQLFEDIGMADVPVVAVDVPSGIGGDEAKFRDDGQPWSAALTVTFFRQKPAHVLYPARKHCGEIVCADIGIPTGMFHALVDQQTAGGARRPSCVENVDPPPPPPLDPTGHKYKRGHCIVVSGPPSATGAARLAAAGALRAGAGLATVVGAKDAVSVLSASLTAVMVREAGDGAALTALLQDKRLNAVVIGPGNGVGKPTQDRVLASLASGAAVVLDADALTSFAGSADKLFKALNDKCVLTPHEGEFEKLFPGVLAESLNRIEAARTAAQRSGAVVLLKGPDTVIAAPSGDAAVNTDAPPQLATAGSGDVLAGVIGGLMAQGMSAFDAARTGAFLHGACGRIAGPGLIAEDLPERLPMALESLRNRRGGRL